jgi:hypothetical protein
MRPCVLSSPAARIFSSAAPASALICTPKLCQTRNQQKQASEAPPQWRAGGRLRGVGVLRNGEEDEGGSG